MSEGICRKGQVTTCSRIKGKTLQNFVSNLRHFEVANSVLKIEKKTGKGKTWSHGATWYKSGSTVSGGSRFGLLQTPDLS